ncbi:MAG: hypothetical protein AAGB51_14145 [Planctomycetota bacterium]
MTGRRLFRDPAVGVHFARVGGLATRLHPMLLCTLVVVLVALVEFVAARIFDPPGPLERLVTSTTLVPGRTGLHWSDFVTAPVMLGIIAFGVLAAQRSTAAMLCDGVRIGLRESIRYAAKRWLSSFAALLVSPVVLVLILWLLSLFGGWLGSGSGWLLVLTGPVWIIAAMVAAVLLVVWPLANPLILPSVACNDADAPDAWARAHAYAVAKPAHLLWYRLVTLVPAVALGVLAFACARAATWILDMTIWSELPVDSAVSGIASLWNTIPFLLASGVGLSGLSASSVATYMLIRQRVDGQHSAELWWPRDEK